MSKSLDSDFHIINKNTKNSRGVLQLFKHLLETDIFILNWTENIPSKKYGTFQTFLFIIFSVYLRLSSKKFVWILHNKQPHNGHTLLSKLCMYFSVEMSDYIFTHSSEGIEFIQNNYSIKHAKKVNYIPHPTYEEALYPRKEQIPVYDLIIWGAINPYKGIIDFLTHYHNCNEFNALKVLICGRSKDINLTNKIKTLAHSGVKFIEGFVSDDDLYNLIAESKAILFPYKEKSILSSGALVKSILYQKPIIGPATGAFFDLYQDGIVKVFSDYSEIPVLLSNIKYNEKANFQYIKNNTWFLFGKKVKAILDNN